MYLVYPLLCSSPKELLCLAAQEISRSLGCCGIEVFPCFLWHQAPETGEIKIGRDFHGCTSKSSPSWTIWFFLQLVLFGSDLHLRDFENQAGHCYLHSERKCHMLSLNSWLSTARQKCACNLLYTANTFCKRKLLRHWKLFIFHYILLGYFLFFFLFLCSV